MEGKTSNMLTEETVFCAVIVMIWVEFIWEFYLTLRQHKKYLTEVSRPSKLNNILSEETYNKARLYGLDKSSYSIFQSVYSVLLTTALIWFYLIHYVWETSGNVLDHFGTKKNEITQSAVFIFIINTINTFIALPLSIYDTFVLEEKHGFNKQTVSFYVKDKLKSFTLNQVIVVPLGCIAIYIIQIGGDYFFFYLWIFTMVTILFFMTIYPDYIAPLFDKYTPLPEGELKTKIEELASSIGFPLYKLYIVEGSKRSVHSNAYFYGFFKNKRIVLFDTLVKDFNKDEGGNEKGCDTEEILAVLAHELGHWKYNHVFKHIIIMQVNIFLMFFVFGVLFKYPQLYGAFGFRAEQPIIIGLIIVLQYVFSPYNLVMNFCLTVLSRKFEFQADKFAVSLSKGDYLKKALIKLHQDNLKFPVYDWLYSSWHHSHPTLLQRLEFIDANKKD